MSAEQIKQAVDNGHTVYVGGPWHQVTKDSKGQYFINSGDHKISLTWRDGITLNAPEADFYISGTPGR